MSGELFLWAGFILSVLFHGNTWATHLTILRSGGKGVDAGDNILSLAFFLSGVSFSAFGYLLFN